MKKMASRGGCRVVAAFAMCLFLTLSPGSSSAQPLRLWYISGGCSDKALEALVSDYNRRGGKQARPVAVQSFEDEAALGAAFETDMPDLLLCSHAKAVQLDSRAVLARFETDADVWAQKVSGLEGVGEYFFPLGARVTVLLTNPPSAKQRDCPRHGTALKPCSIQRRTTPRRAALRSSQRTHTQPCSAARCSRSARTLILPRPTQGLRTM